MGSHQRDLWKSCQASVHRYRYLCYISSEIFMGNAIIVITDSAICIFYGTTSEMYQCWYKHRHWYDFSKLKEDDPFFACYNDDPNLRNQNHGKTGLWQIEAYHISAAYFHKSKQYLIVHNSVGKGGELEEENRFKGMTAKSLEQMDRM